MLLTLGIMMPLTFSLAQNAPRPLPSEDERLDPRKQIDLMREVKSREADYLRGLAAGVTNEARDDTWAPQTEASLRNSYASAHLESAGLESVNCRTTKCEIQVQVKATQSPQSALDQQAAINQWISASTSCGYTFVPGQEPMTMSASVTSIYLACAR
jgi:hypothetical protein